MILHHPRIADVSVTVADDMAPDWVEQGWVSPIGDHTRAPDDEPETDIPDLD